MKYYSSILTLLVVFFLHAACRQGGTANESANNVITPVQDSVQADVATPPQTNSAVIINGITLGTPELKQLTDLYKVVPKPGKYWYDATSGLYGVEGYPAFGFMLPGHKFGTLKANASAGNTGVYVNGRQLPQSEWAVWSQLLGTPIAPGRYWLDGSGNAGDEGNPYPTVNLYLAAQQSSYGGQGGGGDNFWTSRFSAGNYNADNSQGYVSVPGYGPIGYGF